MVIIESMEELPALVFNAPSLYKRRDIDPSASVIESNYYWAVLLDNPRRPEADRNDIFIAGRQVYSEEKLVRIGHLSVEELLTSYSLCIRELGAQLYAKRAPVV